MDELAASRSVAIIGMAGRFPGARNIDEFWENLVLGRESITEFDAVQLDRSRIPKKHYEAENYRPYAGVCPDADLFDATLFGYSAKDAQIIDPNQRLLLELSWELLESAGYNPIGLRDVSVGVFAGQTINTYAFNNLLNNRALSRDVSATQILVANDKDYLATRCSYKLGLSGPSMTVQTACSTSLVAVHLACQSLLVGDCDMALAGAASVKFPQEAGYFATDGDVLSFDGHCRAFDAKATGTVPGNGVGLVLLKRLEEARADGDRILAVIRGSAINNDGHDKVSFTSPSVAAQAAVIRESYAVADVAPESVGFVEAHGTGTSMGDPIELEALSSVFGRGQSGTSIQRYLGSVKTNIGHLDTAAGIAGLIKAVLAVKNATIPATLHWHSHNENVDIGRLPFQINSSAVPWQQPNGPRRAGVSSFGFGGTNAHIVIEEAPVDDGSVDRPAGPEVIPLSAATADALARLQSNLAEHLKRTPGEFLGNVAATLQLGRAALPIRSGFVASSIDAAIENLQRPKKASLFRLTEAAFLFAGQGTRTNIDESLYQSNPAFRDAVEQCTEILLPKIGSDIRAVLFRSSETLDGEAQLGTALAQPALFTLEYALAKLWQSYGVEPAFVLGHSLGEYVAAHVAGVFSLQDALHIVAARGRLMERLRGGAMMAVMLSEEDISNSLPKNISIAAINGPNTTVVSGSFSSVAEFSRRLDEINVPNFKLKTPYAFHSAEIEPLLEEFRFALQEMSFSAPSIPFVSTLTGKMAAPELCQADYWINQARLPVRFHEAITELSKDNPQIAFIEIGTDRTLAKLATQNPALEEKRPVVSSLPDAQKPAAEQFLGAVSEAWASGLDVKWKVTEGRRRAVLPTYPFGRERHWIERHQGDGDQSAAPAGTNGAPCILATPVWERSFARLCSPPASYRSRRAMFIAMDTHQNRAIKDRLAEHFGSVDLFDLTAAHVEERGDASKSVFITHESQLSAALCAAAYTDIVLLSDASGTRWDDDQAASAQLYFLIATIRAAIAAAGGDNPVRLVVLTCGLFEIVPGDVTVPANAVLLGPVLTAPREYPNLSCHIIDVLLERATDKELEILASEIAYLSGDYLSVLRGNTKWLRRFHEFQPQEFKGSQAIRQGGTFLITGGGGHIGTQLSEYLVRKYDASVVVMGRSIDSSRSPQHISDETRAALPSSRKKLLYLGEKILAVRGDVTNGPDVNEAVRLAKGFGDGRIDGIFHLAGVSGNSLIDFKTQEDINRVLAPKVGGTIAVASELARENVDFIVFFSSLSTILPTLGQADYASANAFQSHFARRLATDTSSKVVSIAWDWWATDHHSRLDSASSKIDEMLSASEAFAALETALTSDKVELVASKRGVAALNKWDEYDKLDRAIIFDAASLNNTSPVSDQILEIWRRVLGSDMIGFEDDFIAVGGHSLSAMRVISHVQQVFKINLPFREVFQSMRTPRAMTNYILTALEEDAAGSDEKVEALASEILGMSEAEIKRIIQGVQALG